MFKHSKNPSPIKAESAIADSDADQEAPLSRARSTVKDASPGALRELLEKNLKWSQIIYEQNRRINHKLLWMAVGSWIRLVIIVAPLILALIFLPPLVKDFFSEYGSLLSGPSSAGKPALFDPSKIERLLELIPLDPAQKERLRMMLK